MLRILSVAFLLVLLVSLIVLHSIYGLGYISRVYLLQDSDTGDINWKPQFKLQRATKPSELPLQTETDRATAAFSLPSSADDLDAFFEQNNSTSLLILQNGQLIYEAYFNDSKADQPVATFSISKSVFSMLLGRILGEDTQEFMQKPITRYLPELEEKDSRFALITPAHLINMRSGAAFSSDVSFPFLMKTNLLSTTQTIWSILCLNTWKSKVIQDHSVTTITIQTCWHLRLNAQPANLSQSFYNRSSGHQLEQSMTRYQFGWWIVPHTDGSTDYAAMGHLGRHLSRHLGQYIYISPRNNIVIVRTGKSQGNLDDAEFLKLFYDAAQALGKEQAS